MNAVWQPGLATVFECNTLHSLIIHSLDSSISRFTIENPHVKYLWLSKLKTDSLSGIKIFSCLSTLRISDAHRIETLAGVEDCTTIQELDIENAKLLHDISKIVYLQSLSNLRLIKLSKELDVSVVKNCGSIDKLCIGGPNAPELPWTDLLKKLTLKKVIGWWDPLKVSKDELLSIRGLGKELLTFDASGSKKRQLLKMEFN